MFRNIWAFFRGLLNPPLKVHIVSGDSLPPRLPKRDLVLVRDDGEDWCVGMRCPCGCERTIELLVFPEADPGWRLKIDSKKRPTLFPSVWLKDGCKSHFWVRCGKIDWCE